MLREKSVGELKRLLDEKKADYSDCLEKAELIQRMLSTEEVSNTVNGTQIFYLN